MNPMEKVLEKRKQHQRISHIWLITKNVCVNMGFFSH